MTKCSSIVFTSKFSQKLLNRIVPNQLPEYIPSPVKRSASIKQALTLVALLTLVLLKSYVKAFLPLTSWMHLTYRKMKIMFLF